MTPEDLTRIRFVSEPRISPDGGRVAFVVTTLSKERDEYLSNIWLVDIDGSEPRPFTTGTKRDNSPRWSPDGSVLAFVSERDGHDKPQLFVVPSHGREARRVTELANGVKAPVWSPDGTRLAFVSRVNTGEPEEEGKSKPPRFITSLKYKSNDEGFIYNRRSHVFVVALDGNEPVQVTHGDFDDAHPAWSLDGSLIAFVSARHEDRDYDNARDVFVVSPKGGEPRRVTGTAGPASHPAFSPDGLTIAYLGHRYLTELGRNERLYIVPTEGGDPACLTEHLDRSVDAFAERSGPLWTPDGQKLLFAVMDRGAVGVFSVETVGRGVPTPLLSGERQILEMSLSAGGDLLAFTATDPTSPPEVFLCDSDGTEERRLTDLNGGWKAEATLSQPERITFERDGRQMDCWVMKPFGFQEGRRYPTLLSIHGGPHTQYGYPFFDEFQVYAGAGYAVVFTNPRGSEGYGEDFRRAVIGDWGGGDYEDVMAGLDAALKHCDFIDPDRLGVMGGSYGGFMTSWVVGHTNRFKAACSERAVNNAHSLFGTSDIGHFFQEAEYGALPWDNMEWYVERSPLTYAKNIHTPLLIIHSEDDRRCPIEQGEQLFVALKKLRREVLFVRFPEETHELSRSGKPRHRIQRLHIILDWFARYLRPGD
ncbi:MAG: Dipeptidyl aminopeptidase/acylaminoacyl peptidase [Chloroflexi bacterium]|jgi:dipeptidyl aminopeptidase/acylaminoacyl peptidase|nr:MAG: Dipeptidyl aminopeptidase/acylaminoacyl peptidase [Chloroflexota bacterium]